MSGALPRLLICPHGVHRDFRLWRTWQQALPACFMLTHRFCCCHYTPIESKANYISMFTHYCCFSYAYNGLSSWWWITNCKDIRTRKITYTAITMPCGSNMLIKENKWYYCQTLPALTSNLLPKSVIEKNGLHYSIQQQQIDTQATMLHTHFHTNIKAANLVCLRCCQYCKRNTRFGIFQNCTFTIYSLVVKFEG